MAVIREGNFRGRASLQIDWKGAFSRHFAINFSSASGFEADGGRGRPVAGQIKSFYTNLGSRSQKTEKTRGGGSWRNERKQDYYLQKRNKERLIPQPCLDVPGLFTLSKPGQSRSCDLWDGDSKPRGGSCYSCPVREKESDCQMPSARCCKKITILGSFPYLHVIKPVWLSNINTNLNLAVCCSSFALVYIQI